MSARRGRPIGSRRRCSPRAVAVVAVGAVALGAVGALALGAVGALALGALACGGGATQSTSRTPPPSSAPCNSLDACRIACRDAPGTACVRYAFLAAGEPDVTAGDEFAALLRAACEAGTPRACAQLALSTCDPAEDGPSGCAPEALELFRRACDAGDGYGCDGVALAYEGRVLGVDPDAARVDEFRRRGARAFEAACGPETFSDCLEASDRLRSVDPARAEALAARGVRDSAAHCDHEPRDALACVAAANWFERTRDPRADGYWRRACDLGIRSVCPGAWAD